MEERVIVRLSVSKVGRKDRRIVYARVNERGGCEDDVKKGGSGLGGKNRGRGGTGQGGGPNRQNDPSTAKTAANLLSVKFIICFSST